MEQSAAQSQPQTDLNTDDIKAEFMTLLNTLSAFKSQITMISSQVKSLEKKVKKRMKLRKSHKLMRNYCMLYIIQIRINLHRSIMPFMCKDTLLLYYQLY